MLASILVWLIIGVAAGWFASLMARRVDGGLVAHCVYGSLGALLGGFLSTTLGGGRSLLGFNLSGLLAACVGAFILLHVSRVISRMIATLLMTRWTRWRARSEKMPPTVTCDIRGPCETATPCEAPGLREGLHAVQGMQGIQRMDLLLSRFSEDEITRLSKLQLHYQDQPHTFDQPLEERRLQFVRWLVEHGRLSENVEPGREERPWEEAEELRHPSGGSKWSSGASPRPLDGEPTPQSACREPPEGWRAALLHSVSWLRQSIRTARATDGHGENFGRLPRDMPPASPYGRVGWSFEAPWLWMGHWYDS
jgi:uncharacterized membrane protein YeaQ/YmgE (transglycosylase-associated protein family)/succinate dehydrogenase flavin-adding protein (antitoxin of CptAB toxin-antitoxin module)